MSPFAPAQDPLGDKVMGHGAFVGTDAGEFMGIPDSGQAVRIPFADTLQWRDGKFAGR